MTLLVWPQNELIFDSNQTKRIRYSKERADIELWNMKWETSQRSLEHPTELVTVRYVGLHVNGHWRSDIRLVAPLSNPFDHSLYSQRKYTLWLRHLFNHPDLSDQQVFRQNSGRGIYADIHCSLSERNLICEDRNYLWCFFWEISSYVRE